MAYRAELEAGLLLQAENRADQTIVSLTSGTAGSQQAQQTGFTTGRWTAAPALYRRGLRAVLVLQTATGATAVEISAGGIHYGARPPDLTGAVPHPLQEVPDVPFGAAFPPMAPLPPLAPLPGMAPMEMRMGGGMEARMGNMTLQMNPSPAAPTPAGSTPPDGPRRFCTQCGKEAAPAHRFCGTCGAALSQSP